jgi:hypothetical protein
MMNGKSVNADLFEAKMPLLSRPDQTSGGGATSPLTARSALLEARTR